MSSKVSLLTTTESFDELHATAQTGRGSAKVSREQLLHLLIDHSVMVKALQGSSSFTVTEPRKRERPRLGAP